jgi:hypothetical protein
MLEIEALFVANLLNIFGNNIFLFSLYVFGSLAAIILMLRLPFILVVPLFLFMFFMMMEMPTIGPMIVLIVGLVLGILIAGFIFRNVMGG